MTVRVNRRFEVLVLFVFLSIGGGTVASRAVVRSFTRMSECVLCASWRAAI
jgi:hypothetical protein